MTDTEHTTHTPPPPMTGLSEAEILRNIAIKSANRPACDNQGRPTESLRPVTYQYDDRGRIVAETRHPAIEETSPNPVLNPSPILEAMRAKAAKNHQEWQELRERAKTDFTLGYEDWTSGQNN